MEAEKEEAASKRYNDPCRNILFVVKVAAVVAILGYWYLPAMMNQLHEVMVWFDWFTCFLRNLFFVFLAVNVIIFLIYVSFRKTTTAKKKPDLYDQYLAAFPPPPRASLYDFSDILNGVYYNNSSYRETVPAVQAVEPVEESICTYDRKVVEVTSKSYRRTKSEKKKTEKKVEYRRTESERVMKTASWRSQTMDGLSSEEFRMTVETFITEKKKSLLQEMDPWQNGAVPQWQQNGVDNHLQNGVVSQWQQNSVVPQWQNGVVPQLQNGVVPQLQNGVVAQLENGVVPQWQNGVPEPQNGVVQWQGSRDDGSGRHRHRHGHRSRSHKLVGGAGSNGSGYGSYLAISN